MTNDTTPATDEQIAARDWSDPKQVGHDDVQSLIARIEALQSEITALKTTPRELVEAVKAYRVEKERGWPSDRPIDDAYFEACDKLEKLWQNVCSALSAHEPKVCGFEKHDDKSGKYFVTDCGHETWINETSETFTHCPYCGSPIKVKES